MEEKDNVYESVHNYTKFKLVEMLINRMNGGKVKVNDINSIEDLAEDVLKVLSICGLKYYSELKGKFERGE